jgi:FtsP/CotA-like multicopper oxidase with cupredoxin domain
MTAFGCDRIGSNAPVAEKKIVIACDQWALRARKQDGGHMSSSLNFGRLLLASVLCLSAVTAGAQTFRVQCPNATTMHPLMAGHPNPSIKCQQISGGDGYATMGDGTQTYLFAFGPLSGLADMANGLPGTQPASVFNQPWTVSTIATDAGAALSFASLPVGNPNRNSAVGLVPDPIAGGALTGHVDPRPIMDVGVLNGNMPAPMMAIDEDDEFFLTLTNVGQIMRPDLFEQHTVHFHGYPNASAFYDGVPDASVAINIGGSFTYYYLAPDAGTYFWHCHITPPEHLQMGMVGQLYVRPRQDKVVGSLYGALSALEGALPASPTTADYERVRKACNGDIVCSAPLPAAGDNGLTNDGTKKYAYNDGDGSTAYNVEYPIQMMGFDPNFHFVGMTFNPEGFAEMKDKFFMLNGRSYPDTITAGPMTTQVSDGTNHFSQPVPTIINIPLGGKALLRISDLDVTEYQTLASLGIPMHVIAVNARLLRDLHGNDMTYYTNSITMAGGESTDVILDATDTVAYPVGRVFYLYTPNLDHLSNDAENFGGLMTEVHICTSVDPSTKACTI